MSRSFPDQLTLLFPISRALCVLVTTGKKPTPRVRQTRPPSHPDPVAILSFRILPPEYFLHHWSTWSASGVYKAELQTALSCDACRIPDVYEYRIRCKAERRVCRRRAHFNPVCNLLRTIRSHVAYLSAGRPWGF